MSPLQVVLGFSTLISDHSPLLTTLKLRGLPFLEGDKHVPFSGLWGVPGMLFPQVGVWLIHFLLVSGPVSPSQAFPDHRIYSPSLCLKTALSPSSALFVFTAVRTVPSCYLIPFGYLPPLLYKLFSGRKFIQRCILNLYS